MAIPVATNFSVFIVRDAVEKKAGEIILPSSGRIKPHKGTVFSIGGKVTDPEIKKSKGKKVCFHQGIGFTMEIDGKDYLVLQENEIVAILDEK